MVGHDSTITVRLAADIVANLDQIASEDDVTRSIVVRRAVLSMIAARTQLRDARG